MDRRQGEVGAPAQPRVQRGNAAFSGALISARDSDNIACLRLRQPQNWWLSFLWFPFGNTPKKGIQERPPPIFIGDAPYFQPKRELGPLLSSDPSGKHFSLSKLLENSSVPHVPNGPRGFFLNEKKMEERLMLHSST